MELELATNEELIAELMRRSTFRGLVAWQVESFKGEALRQWHWRSNNCPAAEVIGELAAKFQTGEI